MRQYAGRLNFFFLVCRYDRKNLFRRGFCYYLVFPHVGQFLFSKWCDEKNSSSSTFTDCVPLSSACGSRSQQFIKHASRRVIAQLSCATLLLFHFQVTKLFIKFTLTGDDLFSLFDRNFIAATNHDELSFVTTAGETPFVLFGDQHRARFSLSQF